jgi:hypothetical protein
MTQIVRRLGLALAAFVPISAIVYASGGAGTNAIGDPGLDCYPYSSNSASYCAQETCRVSVNFAPYQGYTKLATWDCCYNPDGTLNGAKHYSCSPQVVSSNVYPNGCCSSISDPRDIPGCPQQHCDPTHP